ncbi:MAG: nuclear transport factor 2 family protein [Pseudomonadota bacterium]|nr:nuclear transport factor 2 family protein [Pseudomonadota bacterium]
MHTNTSTIAVPGSTPELSGGNTDGATRRGDAEMVAALDRRFQAAVKVNDADTMREILHPEFFLILGDGRVQTYEDIVSEAARNDIEYEIQDEEPGSQTVRVWGDTAVVTAKLHIKGAQSGRTFERILWFSDTYVRTRDGWRYALGQASLPLPS